MDEIIKFDLNSDVNDRIITVIGVGGGGSAAANYLYINGFNAVNYLVCNTDIREMSRSPIPNKIQLGSAMLDGLGAGNNPDNGKKAAKDSIDDIIDAIPKQTKMVFLAAGMGGGTGTGAVAVIAEELRKMEVLTVAVVTLPFRYTGKLRENQAREGVKELHKYVDSLIIIDNERIMDLYPDLIYSQAVTKSDEVMYNAVKGVAELIILPGKTNLDFEDIKHVLKDSGVCLMGTSSAGGEDRSIIVVKDILNSPLLKNSLIKGAKHVVVNVVSSLGESEVTLDEIYDIIYYIRDKVETEVDIIYGVTYDNVVGENISVVVIATNFDVQDQDNIFGFEMLSNNNDVDENFNEDIKSKKEDISHEEKTTSKKEHVEYKSKEEINIVNEDIVTSKNTNKEDQSIVGSKDTRPQESHLKNTEHIIKKEEPTIIENKEEEESGQEILPVSFQDVYMHPYMKEEDISRIEDIPAYKRHTKLVK